MNRGPEDHITHAAEYLCGCPAGCASVAVLLLQTSGLWSEDNASCTCPVPSLNTIAARAHTITHIYRLPVCLSVPPPPSVTRVVYTSCRRHCLIRQSRPAGVFTRSVGVACRPQMTPMVTVVRRAWIDSSVTQSSSLQSARKLPDINFHGLLNVSAARR